LLVLELVEWRVYTLFQLKSSPIIVNPGGVLAASDASVLVELAAQKIFRRF